MILSPMHLENEIQYKIAIYSSFNKKKKNRNLSSYFYKRYSMNVRLLNVTFDTDIDIFELNENELRRRIAVDEEMMNVYLL